MKITAVSQWTARFNIQRKTEKCWCLLRNLSFELFDHKKIPGLFQNFSKIPGHSRTGGRGNHDIRGVAFFLAKRVHDSSEITPYSFRMSYRLICPQDSTSSSKLVPKTYLDRRAREIFLNFDRSSVGCKMGAGLGVAILICLLSIIKMPQLLS